MIPGLLLPSDFTRYSGMRSASWPSWTWVRNSHLLPCAVTFALVAPTKNGVSDLVTTSVWANTCGLIIDPKMTSGLPSRMRFIAFSESVLDAPVSSVVSASFLPSMPPAALISSTANSTPLRAWVPSKAVLPVKAVVRPSGIGEGQLAASAYDGPAAITAREKAAKPAIAFFITIEVITFPIEWSACMGAYHASMTTAGLSLFDRPALVVEPLLEPENYR